MKLELEISDDLWKRIEHRASLFNVPTNAFLLRLLEQEIPAIPDRAAAIAWFDQLIAEAGNAEDEESDADLKDLLKALDRHRDWRPENSASARNGVAS